MGQIQDPAIRAQWRLDFLSSEDGGVGMTDSMVKRVMDELLYHANVMKGADFPIDPSYLGVYKSDTAVSEAERQALQEQVKALEHVPDHGKDWHPGSRRKVLNLVDPSLYPLILDCTMAVDKPSTDFDDIIGCGGQEVAVPLSNRGWIDPPGSPLTHGYYAQCFPSESKTVDLMSSHYQWLPADVELLHQDGRLQTRFRSYINNLHPHAHRSLYGTMEQILARCVPLWDRVMADVKDDLAQEMVVPAPEAAKYDLLSSRPSFQVIVKLANIELEPGQDRYDLGSWNVAGQLNERIRASAIYYYDEENVTAGRLAFRHNCLDVPVYAQKDEQGVKAVFGKEAEEMLVQPLGSVVTRPGRLLAFSNTLQHRLLPFELADKSRRGWRKILAFFLVDPTIPLISTATVPPQQRTWWAAAVRAIPPFSHLPQEIFDMIISVRVVPRSVDRRGGVGDIDANNRLPFSISLSIIRSPCTEPKKSV
ncbi:MAG: hypothetical protein M1826_003655 [Phylliscum demangeonii]|nr:MAG: hypothetical protein M1826_003655 [Phylliscum demangeonii]